MPTNARSLLFDATCHTSCCVQRYSLVHWAAEQRDAAWNFNAQPHTTAWRRAMQAKRT